jgi:hypothetical protein
VELAQETIPAAKNEMATINPIVVLKRIFITAKIPYLALSKTSFVRH